MKHLIVSFLLVMFMAANGISQIAAGIQVGYAQSAFEDHDGKSGAVPLGIHAGTTIIPGLEIGGEVSILLVPFTLTDKSVNEEFDVTQTVIGAYGKYFFPMPAFDPYARFGIGYYMGGWEQGGYDGDFDGAVGFNVGFGVETPLGIYGEFVYHIVSRKGDWEGAKSNGANNWGIHAGYSIEL